MKKNASTYFLWGTAILLIIATLLYFFAPSEMSFLVVAISSGFVIISCIISIFLLRLKPLFWLSFLPALLLGSWIYAENPQNSHLILLALAWATASRVWHFFLQKDLAARNASFAHDLRILLPQKALVFVDNDNETETDRTSIAQGHLIRVRQNENIPADGIVVFGSSLVEEGAITGDSEPRPKSPGNFVYAGSTNKSSSFIFRVVATEKETALLHLADFLENGLPRKLSFAFPILMLDLLILLGFAMKFYGDNLSPLEAFSFLLLAQAAPFGASLLTADFAFASRACALGTWWCNNRAVRKTAKAGTLCTDSNAVLVQRKKIVSAVCGSKKISDDGVLRLMAPLARRIDNEAGQAVLLEIRSRHIPLEIMESYIESSGGISGFLSGEEYRWIDDTEAKKIGIQEHELSEFIDSRAKQGDSSALLLCNGQVIGAIAFSQNILNECAQGLEWLQKAQITLILISEKSKQAVAYLANKLSIQHKFSEIDETEILTILRKLGEENLNPLWLCTNNHLASPPKTIKMGAGILNPNIWDTLHLWSLRQDILSVAKVIKLARRSRFTRQILVFFFITSESALIAFASSIPLMSLVFFSIIPGFVGFLISKNLDNAYLEIH